MDAGWGGESCRSGHDPGIWEPSVIPGPALAGASQHCWNVDPTPVLFLSSIMHPYRLRVSSGLRTWC